MTNIVRRHPLIVMLLIFNTFGQAVALVPVVAYRHYGVQLDVDLILAGVTLLFLLAPALVITHLSAGPQRFRKLLREMFTFRVKARWYVLVFVGFPVLTVLLQGSTPPGGWNIGRLADAYVYGFLASLLFNFVSTNWWEESVWMGFFQAPLQDRFGPFVAVLLTSPFFLLEHVTLVLPGSTLGGGWSSLVALLVVVPFARAAAAYVYNRTASLMMVGLVHAASNAVGFGLMMRLYGAGGNGVLIFVLLGLVALVATRGRLGRPRPPVETLHGAGHSPVSADGRLPEVAR